MSAYLHYSDQELLTAIKVDDQGAFTDLVRRYWKRCHANAYARVNDHDVAKELVQDIFMSLWDKRHTKSIENVSSYLYTSVKNKCLNYIEHKLQEKKYWEYYKNFLTTETVIKHHPIDLASLQEQLDAGLSKLPAKSQLVFKMSRMDGRSITEIAKTLNLSEKAIEYHITQCLKKLRVHLKDYIVPMISLISFCGF